MIEHWGIQVRTTELYQLLENGALAEEYKITAVLKLMTSWDNENQDQCPKVLEPIGRKETCDIGGLSRKRKGDAPHGKEIYSTYLVLVIYNQRVLERFLALNYRIW